MAEIERNVIAPSVQLPNTPEATFPQAADSWMETKRQEVGEGTARYYAATLRQLKAFFGRLKLSEIQREHITEYRRQRQVPHEYDGRTYAAGPITINHEISTLFQILERAGLRAPIARNYKPMRKPRKGPGQRLELEELRHLLRVAEQSSRWKIACLCSIVSATTAAGPGEILNLRLKDLDFKDRTLTFVQGTKLDGDRIRTIPMTDDCYRALEELAKLAREKGSVLPDHYFRSVPPCGDRSRTRPSTWEAIERHGKFSERKLLRNSPGSCTSGAMTFGIRP